MIDLKGQGKNQLPSMSSMSSIMSHIHYNLLLSWELASEKGEASKQKSAEKLNKTECNKRQTNDQDKQRANTGH